MPFTLRKFRRSSRCAIKPTSKTGLNGASPSPPNGGDKIGKAPSHSSALPLLPLGPGGVHVSESTGPHMLRAASETTFSKLPSARERFSASGLRWPARPQCTNPWSRSPSVIGLQRFQPPAQKGLSSEKPEKSATSQFKFGPYLAHHRRLIVAASPTKPLSTARLLSPSSFVRRPHALRSGFPHSGKSAAVRGALRQLSNADRSRTGRPHTGKSMANEDGARRCSDGGKDSPPSWERTSSSSAPTSVRPA